MQSAELFAGCGGLALGMSRAGFIHALMAELDAEAVATAQHNKERGVEHVAIWPIDRPLDVKDIQWAQHHGQLALISGGPPCQPFGIGGKKKGATDARNMWPEAIRAVREAMPSGFIFENVRNLAGPKFARYLEWIRLHLAHPRDERQEGETYVTHLVRLREVTKAPTFRVRWQVVNAADYGAPQVRHRVLITGIKTSLDLSPEELKPTHSRDRLLWDQYVTGEYWKRHGIKRVKEPKNAYDVRRVAFLRAGEQEPALRAWITVRDCLEGLGEPNGKRNHVSQPGARVYKGHTGSPLDLPAKALKAGDHGVPGGENMMVLDDGSVRYFSVREAARLVGLPDDYLFPGSWGESMRQLGNAVPAQLAEAAGRWLREMLNRSVPAALPAPAR
jgi:DNA (cytosine-5)-methyltransferase 1